MITDTQIRQIFENYNLLRFNKENYGKYVNSLFKENIDFDISEEQVNFLMKAFKRLEDYPKDGTLYFTTLRELYVHNRSAIELAKEKNIDRTAIYRYRNKAFNVLAKLFNEENQFENSMV